MRQQRQPCPERRPRPPRPQRTSSASCTRLPDSGPLNRWPGRLRKVAELLSRCPGPLSRCLGPPNRRASRTGRGTRRTTCGRNSSCARGAVRVRHARHARSVQAARAARASQESGAARFRRSRRQPLLCITLLPAATSSTGDTRQAEARPSAKQVSKSITRNTRKPSMCTKK